MNKCSKHNVKLKHMAGCSAHPDNWYCPECDKEDQPEPPKNKYTHMPINKLPCDTVLISETFGGNIFGATRTINNWGIADYVVGMEYNGGNYTTVTFRVPKRLLDEVES